jgi:hypothetical protein
MEICGQHHAASLHPRGKELLIITESEMGMPQSRSAHFGEKENLLPMPGIKLRSHGTDYIAPFIYISLCKLR